MSETALQLLRLLAQDAPAERIEEQAAALAAADPSASTVARWPGLSCPRVRPMVSTIAPSAAVISSAEVSSKAKR